MKKTYKSKKGTGLIFVIFLSIAVASLPLFFGAFSWLAFFVLLLVACFIILVFLTIKYEIEEERLLIKCACSKPVKIDINTIKKIVETNNPISSPAASLDRLEITYAGNGKIIISPERKNEFINDIKEINPNVIVKYTKRG